MSTDTIAALVTEAVSKGLTVTIAADRELRDRTTSPSPTDAGECALAAFRKTRYTFAPSKWPRNPPAHASATSMTMRTTAISRDPDVRVDGATAYLTMPEVLDSAEVDTYRQPVRRLARDHRVQQVMLDCSRVGDISLGAVGLLTALQRIARTEGTDVFGVDPTPELDDTVGAIGLTARTFQAEPSVDGGTADDSVRPRRLPTRCHLGHAPWSAVVSSNA